MPRQARLDAAATLHHRKAWRLPACHYSGYRKETDRRQRPGPKGICFTAGPISQEDGHIHLRLGADDEPRAHVAKH
jgi:hypothetical protein